MSSLPRFMPRTAVLDWTKGNLHLCSTSLRLVTEDLVYCLLACWDVGGSLSAAQEWAIGEVRSCSGNTSGTKLQRRRLEQPGKMHEKLKKNKKKFIPPAGPRLLIKAGLFSFPKLDPLCQLQDGGASFAGQYQVHVLKSCTHPDCFPCSSIKQRSA